MKRMKNAKKAFAWVLLAAMLLSMALTGCTKDPQQNTTPTDGSQTVENTNTPPLEE